jgi:KDO2-lipid IV(A) lauroyltransferase
MKGEVPPLPRTLLAPWHWPAWLGFGLVWLIAQLPWRVALRFGAGLGAVLHVLMPGRRRVAAINLRACFPDLTEAERDALLRENFADLGRMLAEFAITWMAGPKRFGALPHHIEGMEHLERARAAGRGVLLVGGHFSHLELCARLIAQHVDYAGMYREHGSPVFEWAIKARRMRYAQHMFGRRELRAVVRYLKRGGTVWYAPDQDMRGKDSVFAPFFGIPASTITATHHLAKMSGAVVIPFLHRRLPDDGGYEIRLEPPLEGFPSDDVVADTSRVNALVETMVRQAPSQYLWIHKRFKTRPPGEPPFYL